MRFVFKTTYLLRVRKNGFEFAEENLCADLLVEVANLERDLLWLEPLDSLDEDLCDTE